MAMRVCATVLWCHTCNLLLCGLLGGANLAMRIFGAGLWCQVRNLLCGLFEGGGLFGHVCLCRCTSVPHVQPPSLWVIWGGGPIWPCMFVPLYFGATHATSFFVEYLGGQFGHACQWCQTSVPCMQPPSLWAIWGADLAMHVCATRLRCHTCNLCDIASSSAPEVTSSYVTTWVRVGVNRARTCTIQVVSSMFRVFPLCSIEFWMMHSASFS